MECVSKLTLDVTTAGDISEENIMMAYNMLLSIAVDEDRPCRKDANGRNLKNDMTPAMKKVKRDAGCEKMEIQDEEVKIVCEKGRSSADVKRKTGIRFLFSSCHYFTNFFTNVALTFHADEESDDMEQDDGHLKKQRRRGRGRVHDSSRDLSNRRPPFLTNYLDFFILNFHLFTSCILFDLLHRRRYIIF